MMTSCMLGNQEERLGKMTYEIKKLNSFDSSAFEADSDLYALSPKAADRYFDDYTHKTEFLKENPYIFQVFEDEPYFRSTPLVYGYRLFFHVEEHCKTVILHRVIHGAMDLASRLREES